MKKIILILICSIFILTGCVNNSKNYEKEIGESDVKVSEVKVTINDKEYKIKLENNDTVNEFIKILPQEFIMDELNGNEKFVYMNNSLTTNSYNPNHIVKGDVMLYGNNCLVIFYKSFDTSYSYTKIGHIDNLDNLGNGSITAKFDK